jgi:hypothetical protein
MVVLRLAIIRIFLIHCLILTIFHHHHLIDATTNNSNNNITLLETTLLLKDLASRLFHFCIAYVVDNVWNVSASAGSLFHSSSSDKPKRVNMMKGRDGQPSDQARRIQSSSESEYFSLISSLRSLVVLYSLNCY